MSNEDKNKQQHETEEKRRKDKMISEGGMAVDEHHFHDQSLVDSQDESLKTEINKKEMDSEGGMAVNEHHFHDPESQDEEEKRKK